MLCPPGIVVVEMAPPPKMLYGLFLPDNVSADCRPDFGIVLACGHDVQLKPGAMVCVRGYDGTWVEDFDVPGYATKNQVRMYGRITPFNGDIEPIPWDESIIAQIHIETEDMTATGRNLIIQRDPIVTSERGLELPEWQHYRTGLATVLSIGPGCSAEKVKSLHLVDGTVEVGDRIHYNQRGELSFVFAGDPDMAIIPDIAVNLVIRAELAEQYPGIDQKYADHTGLGVDPNPHRSIEQMMADDDGMGLSA